MKPLWLAVFVCVCLLVAAGCAPAATPAPPPPTAEPPTPMPPTPAPDLVAPVKAWAEAFNKGDVDAALAFMADDVTWLSDFTADRETGKEQLRPLFDNLVGLETKFQVKDCQPQDDRALCGLSAVDGCIAVFGAPDGLTGRLEFIYQPDGKIRQASLTRDDPRWRDSDKFFVAYNAWALVNRAEEWAKLDYSSEESGALERKLCQEYAASLKVTPTPVADPVATVKAWVDALNKGDVDAALAFFTESATAQGYFQAASKDELSGSFQWLAGMEAKLGAPDCKPGGGGLMCSFTYTDGCVAAAGITEGMGLRGAIDIQPDGKIRKAPLAADGEGWGKYALWDNQFQAWARANHADEWIKREHLEFAPERVKLCQEYAEFLKAPAPTPAPATASSPSTALSDVKLTILYDNTAIDPQLKSDWGFATLVETGGHTVLFDTGANGPMLLDNMRQLNVKPESIEAIIISHEHSDHTGGLQALLDTGIRPVVYAPSEFSKALAFAKVFKEQVRTRTELVEVTDPVTIVPGMHVTRPVGDTIVEQALVVETRDGTVVILGCAHPGLAEMVRQAREVVPGQMALLAGGFHLLEIADKDSLQSIMAELRQLGVERVLPTHCTGGAAIDLFRAQFGESYLDGGVGRTVTISTK